jgi:ABC-type glycerol-3-phosphate transport system substrate-binding protein
MIEFPLAFNLNIRFIHIPPEAGPERVVNDFNEQFKDKGIQLEYERFVNDDQGNLKLETSLMAGNEVDVYVNYATFRLHGSTILLRIVKIYRNNMQEFDTKG